MSDAFKWLIGVEQESLNESQTVYLEAPNNTDIPNQIRQLGELLKDGLLTQEEFNQKKKELLSRL
ncbi:SHOCT domain-containing protein [Pseudanabaena yagii GIHE-NHR1]|uniref:SHOCT domain-containing protein n=2 Tax=Pseudanabaena TaxID=1152 RepID=A0ABX1LPP6_9CYAN|nr:SHOCT domain-containing protein [Pseudanabaena yagii GIHE-NHR1]